MLKSIRHTHIAGGWLMAPLQINQGDVSVSGFTDVRCTSWTRMAASKAETERYVMPPLNDPVRLLM